MKAKKILQLLVVLIVVFILHACGPKQSFYELYSPLYDGIDYFMDTAYVLEEGPYGPIMVYYDEPFEEKTKTADMFFDDKELQTAVTERTRGLVLDNDAAILACAWDLQPILQELSYIPEGYFPIRAARYSNNVVEVIYLNDRYIDFVNGIHEHRNEYLDIEIHVFVSEVDGHIIHYYSMLE